MGHSVLLVPVPELEGFVRGRTAHYDRDYVSGDPDFTHAHITALGPFLDVVTQADVDTIATIAAGLEPFEFTLGVVDTFPNGIIHLVPDPDDPFRALTRALWAAYPQCPPYAGTFDDVRPHLTLDRRSDTVTEQSTRVLLGATLGARCRAERLDLAWYAAGDCHVLRSWRLGNGLDSREHRG